MGFWASLSQHLESRGQHTSSCCSPAALTTSAERHKRPLMQQRWRETWTFMRLGQRRSHPDPTGVNQQVATAGRVS